MLLNPDACKPTCASRPMFDSAGLLVAPTDLNKPPGTYYAARGLKYDSCVTTADLKVPRITPVPEVNVEDPNI